MAKKPALLSDSLLINRPRKGEARAQTESEASRGGDPKPAVAPPRRRRRLSQNTEQLNLRVSPETLARFIDLADKHEKKFGDMLAELLDTFESQ